MAAGSETKSKRWRIWPPSPLRDEIPCRTLQGTFNWSQSAFPQRTSKWNFECALSKAPSSSWSSSITEKKNENLCKYAEKNQGKGYVGELFSAFWLTVGPHVPEFCPPLLLKTVVIIIIISSSSIHHHHHHHYHVCHLLGKYSGHVPLCFFGGRMGDFASTAGRVKHLFKTKKSIIKWGYFPKKTNF